jgi:predicted alpha-1,2-mannosidase
MSSGSMTAVSLMHESGTGGSPKYGTVSQLPIVGAVTSISSPQILRASPDTGSVGYYKMSLANGVQVELAGTAHVGMLQYSFPAGQQANILVDVSHYLPASKNGPASQSFTNGSIQVFGDGHYEGSGTYQGGWNLAAPWTVYFCGLFSESPTSQTFQLSSNTTSAQLSTSLSAFGTYRAGALFSFKSANVTSKVGFSFISSARACQYIDNEVPSGTSLSDIVTASKSAWNSQVLSKITTSETNTTLLGQLYTSLYGMHLLPSNRTGESPNPAWNPQVPYYDDLYTIWDLFRCTTPLYHILQPTMYEGFLQSLIEIWRTDGWLPDGRSSNYNGREQGGSNADNVLADAYVKGVQGQVDWNLGYQALVKDAEVTPPNNHDPIATDSSTQQGRSALPDWLKFGYITTRFSRSVSRAIEYSVNDFSLYQVASGLGKKADATKYLARSRNWRNHWDPTVHSYQTSGFIVPRQPNGAFLAQNVSSCGGCWWGDIYYEGTPWEYTVNVHHDLEALITMGGGPKNFTTRLNTLIDPANSLIDMGNEPGFGTPYLYNFVNQQPLSVKAARTVAKVQYAPGPGGLPGNSDAGAMQSWLLWNMIGLYPLTGQTTFLIQSPWFSNLTIDLENGNTLIITSTNGTVAGLPDEAIYVQSLKVNGKPWTKNWLTWNDVFANGGTMEYVLGTEMTPWDSNGALPPSPASGGDQTGGKGGDWLSQLHAIARNRRLKKVAEGVGAVSGAFVLCLMGLAAWFLSKFIGKSKKKTDDEEKGEKNEEDGSKNEPALTTMDEISRVDDIQETPEKLSLEIEDEKTDEEHSVIMVPFTEMLPLHTERTKEPVDGREDGIEGQTFFDDHDDDNKERRSA